jgi:hypothetical protein
VPRVIGLFSQRESVGALLMRSACSESCRSTLLGSLEIARKCFEFSCAASPRQNLLFLLICPSYATIPILLMPLSLSLCRVELGGSHDMGKFINSKCFKTDHFVFNFTAEETAARVAIDPLFNQAKFLLCTGRGPCAVCVDMVHLKAFTEQMTANHIPVSFVSNETGTRWFKGEGHPVQVSLLVECLQAAKVPALAISLVRLGQCTEVALIPRATDSGAHCILERHGLEVASDEELSQLCRDIQNNMNEVSGAIMGCDVRFDGVPTADIPLYRRIGKNCQIYPLYGMYQLACIFGRRVVFEDADPFQVVNQVNKYQLSGSATLTTDRRLPTKSVDSLDSYHEKFGSQRGTYSGTVVFYCHNAANATKQLLAHQKGWP